MAKRLIKIAKELNVGTTTIVEHLTNNGFEIENKPTANITDEMYNELLKEFQKSIAIKEKADSLIIGNRPTTRREAGPPINKPEADIVKSSPTLKEEPASVVQTPKVEPKKEEPEKVEEKTASPKVEAPKIKVLGKINLEERLRPKTKAKPDPTPANEVKEEKAEELEPKADPVKSKSETTPSKPEEKAPAPKVEAEKKVEEKIEDKPTEPEQPKSKTVEEKPKEKEETKTKDVTPEVTAESAPASAPPSEAAPAKDKSKTVPESEEDAGEEADPQSQEFIRAETPELRGLKILGKIDTDKFKRPKKKKKEKAQKEKTQKDKDKGQGQKPAPSAAGQKTKSSKPQQDTQNKPSKSSDNQGDDPAKKRRKRKRRKVAGPPSQSGNQNNRGRGDNRGRGGRKRDEVKEVSQKEIDEKIKATMARLSGRGKKNRQKIRRESRERQRERQEMLEMEKQTDKLQLTEFVSVSELASLMDVPVTDVITTCMNLGVIVSINQRLDAEIIDLVAEEFGHEVEFISMEEQTEEEEIEEDDPADLVPRSPIVTVMGHVDHGKTSLLDYIRSANVASGEAGGITQHIGAYEVVVGDENKKITFLDTPGHEAFTAMRARGAKVTDIAVIIIAADDNVMPQTREAISHAQAAGVPIVFAINKIDKPGADPERIKGELAQMNFMVESWGGKYQSQDISAKSGENIDLLLEKILLEAELLELKANPDRKSLGTVIEASLDKGRGYVTKLLVQTGTLNIGDPIVAGEHSGKIKAMFNERGKRIKSSGPSTAVLVLGLSGAPQAGERFKEVDSDQEARQIASKRAQIVREQTARATKRISLDEIGRRLALGNFKELNLIIKGDVDGSVEALSDSLIKLSIETVQVNVIHKAVGQITESDVLLASASDAVIIGFQVRPSLGARKLAEREGVQIKMYSIIYEAIEEIKMAIEGMLEPTKEEKITAQVQVREIYKISKIGTVAGCYVQDGKITRNSHVRLIRNGIVVYPTREGQVGEISSLKRFKDDVKEVKSGMECGISIKNFNDIKVDDVIEGYEIIEIKQRLD